MASEERRFLLLGFLSILVLVSCVDANASCAFAGGDAQNFWPAPQPAPIAYPACNQYQSSTCCQSSYAQSVSQRTDPLLAHLMSLFTGASGTCLAQLTSVACLPCSPSSSISHKSATDFCYRAFQPVWDVAIRSTNDDCFAAKRECTISDYEGFYGPCESGSRTAFYVKKLNSDCVAGTQPPAAVTGLPCDAHCSAGQFLPFGTGTCQNCSAGTFSLGGGVLIEDFEEPFPAEFDFSTVCHDSQAGSDIPQCGWAAADGGSHFASEPTLNDSQSCAFTLRVLFVRPGSVRFRFKVDAEPRFDGLRFTFDDVLWSRGLVSVTSGFEEYSVTNIAAGWHLLRWSYEKDYSISVGADQAWISLLEIIGFSDSVEECSPCPPGTASGPAASACFRCPRNSRSPGGVGSCITCEPDEYSYEGSAVCLMRPPCTESDFVPSTAPCRVLTDGRTGRDRTWRYVDPLICNIASPDSLPLPQNEVIACAPCPPGTEPRGDAHCHPCPSGTFRGDNNDLVCSPCDPGTAAVRSVVYRTFDEWAALPDLSSSCTGQCGSPSWRLMSTSIDSGVGHARDAVSVLQMNVQTVHAGFISFELSLLCRYCHIDLEVVGVDSIQINSWNSNSSHGYTRFLDVGNWTVKWKYGNLPPLSEPMNPLDRAVIKSITVTGTADGGATECTTCTPGTIGVGATDVCELCPPGKTSTDRIHCVDCPENTFAPIAGSVTCIPCGPNTYTPAGAAQCTDVCGFTARSRNASNAGTIVSVEYSLRGLVPDGTMTGPTLDANSNEYLFNPCDMRAGLCLDEDEEVINTFVCQDTGIGIGFDLGHVRGYYSLPEAYPRNTSLKLEDGFVATYIYGDEGCARSYHNKAVQRSANVTFLCDPEAGTGFPQDAKEWQPCFYSFVWRTAFACPVCSEKDYSSYLTNCDPATRKQRRMYYWLQTPPRCHGGQGLPEPEEMNCTINRQFCAPGQYLEPNSTQCKSADIGYFSTGWNDIYTRWTEVTDYGFNSTAENCTGHDTAHNRCNAWSVNEENFLQSGSGVSSLLFRSNFVRVDSAVEFDYRLTGTGTLVLQIDSANVWSQNDRNETTRDEYHHVRVTVSAGPHSIRWRFSAGDEDSFVVIRSISISGTKFAATEQFACPPGTYSNKTGSTRCEACPLNTVSTGDASSCAPCPPTHYALPGEKVCQERPDCVFGRDYYLAVSECTGSPPAVRTTYIWAEPEVCDRSRWRAQAESRTLPCGPCPKGKTRNSASLQCDSCSSPNYFNEETGRCDPLPAGTASTPMLQLLSPGFVHLDDAWITGCSGECLSGWRAHSDYVDSGAPLPHMSSDSFLVVNTRFAFDGVVEFDLGYSLFDSYALYADNLPVKDSVRFYVNGEEALFLSGDQLLLSKPRLTSPPTQSQKKREDMTASPAQNDDTEVFATGHFSVPVSRGQARLQWTHYHRGTGRVLLANVTLRGVSDSKASLVSPVLCPRGTFLADPYNCQPCPIGTYTHEAGSTQCNLCEYDTYAPFPAFTGCYPCGPGSQNRNTTQPYCTSSCTWTSPKNAEKYDLSGLVPPLPSTVTEAPIIPSTSFRVGEYNVNVCAPQRCIASQSKMPITNASYSYVCQITEGTNFGTSVEFSTIPQPSTMALPDASKYRFTLLYQHGDICVYDETRTLEGQIRKVAHIDFMCDMSIDVGTPEINDADTTRCGVALRWRTRQACPVCTDADYQEASTWCANGKNIVTYVRIANCSGPQHKNSPSLTSCPIQYSVGPLTFILVFAFFGILVLLLGFCLWKNRSLEHKYSQLSSTRREGAAGAAAATPTLEVTDLQEEL